MAYWLLNAWGGNFTNVTSIYISLARNSHRASLDMTGEGEGEPLPVAKLGMLPLPSPLPVLESILALLLTAVPSSPLCSYEEVILCLCKGRVAIASHRFFRGKYL